MGTGGILYWSRGGISHCFTYFVWGIGVMFPIGAGVEAESTASGSHLLL